MKSQTTYRTYLTCFVLGFLLSTKALGQSWKADYEQMVSTFDAGDYAACAEVCEKLRERYTEVDTTIARICDYAKYSYFFLQDYEAACGWGAAECNYRAEVQGKDSDDYLQTAYTVGIFNTYLADYVVATIRFEESLDWVKRSFGETSKTYLDALNMLGWMYDQSSEISKAHVYYRELEDVIRNNFDLRDSMYQAFVPSMVGFYNTRAIWDRAEPFFTESLAVFEKDFGKDSEYYVASLNALGEFYTYANWFDKAIETYLQYLPFCESVIGKNSIDYLNGLYSLANAYDGALNYQMATQTWMVYLPICEETLGKDHEAYPSALAALADIYDRWKKFDKAVEIYKQYTTACIPVYGEGSEHHLDAIYSQALVYDHSGQFDKAVELFDSITILNQYYNQMRDSLYFNFAEAPINYFEARGMYSKAIDEMTALASKIEKVYGRKSDQYLTAINRIGEINLNASWYDQAEKSFEQFLEESVDFYGENSITHATALNNLAVVYEAQGRTPKSEEMYLEALRIKGEVYTKSSDYYALTLVNLGVLCENSGRYPEAETYMKEALAIYKSNLGDSSDTYGTALSNLAGTYSAGGNYKKANAMYLEALEIKEQIYGKGHFGTIEVLNGLAGTFQDMGQFERSDSMYTVIKNLSEISYGSDHPNYVSALSNLARIKTIRGKYRESEILLIETREIIEKIYGKNRAVYASMLSDFGALYHQMGDYGKSQKYYSEAIKLASNIYDDNDIDYGILLNNAAEYLVETGNLDLGESYLTKSLEIQHNAYGKDHLLNQGALTNLALVYMARKDFQRAEEYMLKAQGLVEQFLGKEHLDYGTGLNNLSTFYMKVGDYEKAEALGLEGLALRRKIYGSEHTETATSLNNVATVYASIGADSKSIAEKNESFKKSQELYQEALHIDTITDMLNSPIHASHLNNLAELYRQANYPNEAKELYHKCLKIEEEHFGKLNNSSAITLNNLALLEVGMGEFDAGLKYAKMALDIKEKLYGTENPMNDLNYYSLGFIYELQGKNDLAYQNYQKSLELRYQLIDESIAFMSEEEKEKFWSTSAQFIDQLASFALKASDDYPEITGILYDIQLKEKGGLLRSSSNVKNAILDSKNDDLLATFENWQSLRQQLSSLYALPEESRDVDPKELEVVADQMEKKLVKESAAFRKGNEQTLSWTDVQKDLADDEVAVEFMRFNYVDSVETEIYCALVLKPEFEHPKIVKLFRSEELEKIIGKGGGTTISFVEKIYGKKDELSSELHKIIWSKLEPVTMGSEVINLAPSGLLHKVSFAALKSEQDGYLSSQYDLRMLSSTAQLRTPTTNVLSEMDMAVFGGAVYQSDKSEREVWSYLQGTLDEAQKIKDLAAEAGVQCQSFTGQTATEDNFKAQDSDKSPTVVHVATHGYFYTIDDVFEIAYEENTDEIDFRGTGIGIKTFVQNQNSLMRTGLVFTGANDVWNQTNFQGEDGVLTAYEVSNMNLEGTKLVVMSACETGLGDIKGSEGVYGLQRAFKIAGVEQLIMSLWQVPDKETSEFMITFYKQLLSSKNIRESFRETQRIMREKYDPYFWAAFVLVE